MNSSALIRPLSLLAAFCLWVPAALHTQEPATLSSLTLEEKASLVTGQNWWETHSIARLGLPSVWMADGPVGLRKSVDDANVPATCFPSSGAMAATWNQSLIERVGSAIGTEARFHNVALLLGPGLNMKRYPLGGRNFEYYSEDPLLSGRTAAAFVRGVESQGVGATLKHFAVNNQEHRRMVIDARLSERALREIYLRAFEIAVREGQPQAVMTAYNKVNGTYATQNPLLLKTILRDEWGFDGLVVSDWGSMDDPVASVAAGMDLEMPGNPLTPPEIVRAVQDGRLAEADLDRAASKVLQLVERSLSWDTEPQQEATEANHELAREVAIESLVLLKNDGILPFTSENRLRIGVLGQLASDPRIQGIGSSQVNPTSIDTVWNNILEVGSDQGHTIRTWQSDFPEIGLTTSEMGELLRFFGEQDALLIFAGQEASHDAEAWDRPSMDLSPADTRLINAAKRVGKPFVVVLVGGGAMDVGGFATDANALLMGWLGGQAFGSAVAQVLFGHSYPSGRLSETFSWSVEDHPAALNFPSGPWHVDYGEGLYVGYRYFQSFGSDVAFPFGHGLSYTTFEYESASAPDALDTIDGGLDVTVRVKNTGERVGAETVQIYLRHLNPSLDRPDRELVGFGKIEIEPGQTEVYSINIEPERFAYYHDAHDRWVIESGDYEVLVGASVEDIRITLPFSLRTGTLPRVTYTLGHTLGDIYQDEQGRVVVDFLFRQLGYQPFSEAGEGDFFAAAMKGLPFKKIANFSEGTLTPDAVRQLLSLINSDMDPEQVLAVLRGGAGW
jgi:beta-glucosidase